MVVFSCSFLPSIHLLKQDYISVDGDMSYGPGETQKTVPVKLLELGEGDGLLEDKQVKQFVMDLSNPRQGAKLGRYPRTTITIADKPGTYQVYRSVDRLFVVIP